MDAPDRIRLQHMLDAAREAISFAHGRSEQDLSTDRMLLLSLVKEIEIIGEAANQISRSFRSGAPTIPWSNIVGMRNHLIHAYSDVNAGVVWKTLRVDLPALIEQVEALLAGEA